MLILAQITGILFVFQTGLLSAEDIDKVCTDGLGLRYAFIGPLETMHLNANGKKKKHLH